MDDFCLNSVHLQSEDRKSSSLAPDTSTDSAVEASEARRGGGPEADEAAGVLGDRCQPGSLQLQSHGCSENSSPPKTASSLSLNESLQSASRGESGGRWSSVLEPGPAGTRDLRHQGTGH